MSAGRARARAAVQASAATSDRRGPAPLVSVVVPTYRRPALLARCLDALAEQDLGRSAFEVIVVDDGRCDASLQVVADRSRRSRLALRYLRLVSHRGPAAARNAGWRAAAAAIVAFTDDDCVPSPGWLRAGIESLGEGIAGAWGKIVIPISLRPTDYERDASWLQQAEFATANCFLRRSVLEEVGGFDERFQLAWREDSDLYFTLIERGHEIRRIEPAVVIHPVRPARFGVSVLQQSKSMFNALLYKKHPALYRARIQKSPPWRYYAILASLVVLTAGVARSDTALSAAGAAAWALLTAEFAVRRLRRTSRAPRHVVEMIVTSAVIPFLSVYWRLRGAIRFRVFFL
ncbi:MAG: glycosyltransferase family 2 protein [Candidatus Eisenbacteria bacterium]